jgi:hypothetical protein
VPQVGPNEKATMGPNQGSSALLVKSEPWTAACQPSQQETKAVRVKLRG